MMLLEMLLPDLLLQIWSGMSYPDSAREAFL